MGSRLKTFIMYIIIIIIKTRDNMFYRTADIRKSLSLENRHHHVYDIDLCLNLKSYLNRV